MRVAQNDFERRTDLVLARATPHVEKNRRTAAVMLDDVHRCHREPGPVHEARDVAVEFDVIQVELARFDSSGASSPRSRMAWISGCPIKRVVVETHFCIERHHGRLAVGGFNQAEWIDYSTSDASPPTTSDRRRAEI